MGYGQSITVGVLLLTYKDRPNEKQRIGWVRLDDFHTLQTNLTARKRHDSLLAAIKAEVARLRAKGVKPQEMARAGLNLEQLKLLSARPLHPVASYNIVTVAGTRYINFKRKHEIQLSDIAQIELIKRQQVVLD